MYKPVLWRGGQRLRTGAGPCPPETMRQMLWWERHSRGKYCTVWSAVGHEPCKISPLVMEARNFRFCASLDKLAQTRHIWGHSGLLQSHSRHLLPETLGKHVSRHLIYEEPRSGSSNSTPLKEGGPSKCQR